MITYPTQKEGLRLERDAVTDTQLLTWATLELNRQMDEQRESQRTCAVCGTVAAVGYHATCDHCGKPVCGVCAVQLDGLHFCPTCPPDLPF